MSHNAFMISIYIISIVLGYGVVGNILKWPGCVEHLTRQEQCEYSCPISFTHGTDWSCVKSCLEIK